ncbi:quinoprotein dehydrogenase-associated putative ABC transporter substrate-binding protein [Nevskia sp.]|uniref:quinoprotein dehydrogenase-associated putative ABC transporter substrate-binding protein n=1 Tax=Nevskia sp. TaxID=1929292 RepID=UPI0025ED8A0B|nr:quinoprotein dehydrogenase-associated putative ABC transporter substrate-binding protein [Nevskia sp.]
MAVRNTRPAVVATAALLLASVLMPVRAQDAEKKAFRICRDPNNLPFQNVKGEGFEDKIAELFAADLGIKVQAFDYPARFNFIRNTLRFKLPGDDYPCDIVMDVPAGFSQGTASTKPYYRSTYAMAFPRGKALAGVTSVEQFLALPQEKLAKLKIGIIDKSPASDWMAKRGLLDIGVPYRVLVADPDQSSGGIIEADLIAGKLDAVIVWGPIAGYYAKRYPQADLLVLPMQSEHNVRFDFEIAMAVRIPDKALKQTLDELIVRNQSKIEAILNDYGVPLLPPAPPAAAAAN